MANVPSQIKLGSISSSFKKIEGEMDQNEVWVRFEFWSILLFGKHDFEFLHGTKDLLVVILIDVG